MTDIKPAPTLCAKGTFLGAAAIASLYGFAPCVLDAGRTRDCDSGPAPLPEAA